jgi:hypothetical protein
MGSNTDKYRQETDQGRGRDKAAFPDPAAAPLETDSEAGSAAADGADRSQVQNQETSDGRLGGPAESDESTRTISGEMKRPYGMGLAALAAVIALGIIVAATVLLVL